MKKIPSETILKVNNYSDRLGDAMETFNLDLYSNLGAIRATRTKLVTNSVTQTDLEIPVAFAYYNDEYYLVTDDFVYKGGRHPSDPFTKVTQPGAPTNEMNEGFSDAEIFNGKLYVSGFTTMFSLSGGTWAEPVSGLSNSPHLLKTYGDRLYITNLDTRVVSINTSNTLVTSGSNTLNLGIDASAWTISMLEAGETQIWIGCINTDTGKGLMFTWDGETENTPTRRIELDAGVMAGTIKDNVPYIVDTRGRLLVYTGNGFTEIDKLPVKSFLVFEGARASNNLRFINPNGMITTDYGTILFLFKNELETPSPGKDRYNLESPSGIYEWHPDLGLYHKYSLSTSSVGGVTTPDYGAGIISETGAILFTRSTEQETTDNGTILAGAKYFTGQTTSVFGVFTDDTLKTTPAMGYFVTAKLPSDGVADTWAEIYAQHSKLINASDQIVVKYRTTEKNSLLASCDWVDATTFTTLDDISDYEEGHEVVIMQGSGAGQSMHIVSLETDNTTKIVRVDANPLSATGGFKARFTNFKKSQTVTESSNLQWHKFNTTEDNVSPWCQYKVELYFTGDQELYKLTANNKPNVRI